MNRLDTRTIGKYEVLGQLATTGLASVFRARDTTSDKVVALKVLHPYFSREAGALDRFLQEMERVRELNHPNIVAVHDIEKDGDVTAIVMDYVSWPTLKAKRGQSMSPGEVVSILRQVAAALDYAHTLGVVHRDLRPANVFYDQESGQAKVSDFGTIALVESGHPLLRTTVNTPAPNYAPPEQIQGQPPDPRNDIYALGVLAYELLTGELPFDALSPYTLLARQLTTIPERLSLLNSTLPPAVDNVVIKALNRRPEERQATCGELVDALAHALGPLALHEPAVAGIRGTQHIQEEANSPAVSTPQPIEEGRIICLRCSSGNPSTATRCQTCWSDLTAQPIMTQEQEQQWLRRYWRRLRLKKRIIWGTTVGVLAILLALWVYSDVIKPRIPLPSPTTAISSQSAVGEWTMVQNDLLHTGVVPGASFVPTGAVQPIFQSSGPIMAAPAVANGKVYVSTSDRRIVAMDKTTGQIAWTYEVSGPVNSSPAVADGLVFVGLRDGQLLALDAATGNLAWSYQTHNPIYGSATVADGTLYLGSGDHFLYALDAQTGNLRWKLETGDWIFAAPTVEKGVVTVGSQDGELYMVNASNGTLRYQVNTNSTLDKAATIVGDVAYLSSRTGTVVAFNYLEKDVSFRKASIWLRYHLYIWEVISKPPALPGLQWARQLKEPIMAEMATADGKLFVATAAGNLRALDLKTGKDVWQAKGLPRLYSAPMISGDTVVQAASDGTIHGFNISTGNEQWKVSIGEEITASPILAEGVLYVPTNEGSLYAIH